MRMSEAFTELEVLREATSVRLSPEALVAVRDLAETYDAMRSDNHDALVADGLAILLAMHDKLEAARNGH